MKNYNKIYFYLFTLIGIFTIAACSDDDNNNGLDNEAPVITINEPTEDEVVEVGGEVHLDIDLEDDIELASYKIEVHNNFDGHTHGDDHNHDDDHNHGRPSGTTETIPWVLNQTHELEAGQQSFHLHDHLEAPDNATEGAYHLGIIVLDAAGNQSEAYVEIIVGEDHSGEEHGISITNIVAEDVERGNELDVLASITAEHGIQTISVNLHGHDLVPEGNEIEWTFEENYSNYTGTATDFHEHIDVPANAAPGEYHITITVIDAEENVHAEGLHFHVTN